MMALQQEDVAQHSYGVAVIAHALCVIDQELYDLHPPLVQVMTAALFHDASEAILTDVVAPVKKYNPEIEQAFAKLEGLAESQILATLPQELGTVYQTAFQRDDPVVWAYIKAADKLDALCKCKQEVRRGNQDFKVAEQQLTASCEQYAEKMPSVRYFIDVFLPAFDRSIDEVRYLL